MAVLREEKGEGKRVAIFSSWQDYHYQKKLQLSTPFTHSQRKWTEVEKIDGQNRSAWQKFARAKVVPLGQSFSNLWMGFITGVLIAVFSEEREEREQLAMEKRGDAQPQLVSGREQIQRRDIMRTQLATATKGTAIIRVVTIICPRFSGRSKKNTLLWAAKTYQAAAILLNWRQLPGQLAAQLGGGQNWAEQSVAANERGQAALSGNSRRYDGAQLSAPKVMLRLGELWM